MATKTEARQAIREARETLRDLELALREPGPVRDYVLTDEEADAILSEAFWATRYALEG